MCSCGADMGDLGWIWLYVRNWPEGMAMLAMKRKRVAMGSVFVAATIGLAPLGWTQASAATPTETHVSTSATAKVHKSGQDYRRGFKDGFRSGLRQAQRSCHH